jgi:amino acid transporter
VPQQFGEDFVLLPICTNERRSISIPLLSYGFVGVEIVSVTAFEAHNRKSLRFPARWVSYIIAGIYLTCGVLEAVVVNWNDKDLPSIERRSEIPSLTARADEKGPGFYAVIVIAARTYGATSLGWYFNACIIYFCMSAANTSLYVASRTLFGLTRGINRMQRVPWYLRPIRHLGITSPFARYHTGLC